MSITEACRKYKYGVCEYIKKKYQGHRFGRPVDAAELLIDDYGKLGRLVQDMKGVFNDMNEHLDVAGRVLKPGMRLKVKRDVRTIVNLQKMMNSL